MARLLLSMAALLLAVSIQAQEIILDEQFNDGTLGIFSQYSAIGDNQTWEAREFGGKQFAQMNGFDDGIQDNEDWLISPALNLDQYADEVLTFESACNFNGPNLDLMVSTDYDGTSDPNAANWTDLSQGANWSTGDYEYVYSGEIDLSSYEGTAYIAFKYVSNTSVEGKLWQVDSILVQATVLSDINEPLAEKAIITNPVVQNDQLAFTVLDATSDLSFSINSIEGRTLKQFKSEYGTLDMQISVADLPKGIYVLAVKNEYMVKAYQFIR